MACPYFMPLAKLENGSWPHPSRLPLGGGWSGHCTAPGHEAQTPAQGIVESFCNLGYAEGCSWAPPHRAWDSVRFAVSAPGATNRNTADLPRRTLRVLYVCERDHRPVTHGELTFDLATSTWHCCHDDPRIQKMAECFLDSYLNKKA